MNSAFDDTILGAEIDPTREKSCFERSDIHLIMKIKPFLQDSAFRNSGAPVHFLFLKICPNSQAALLFDAYILYR